MKRICATIVALTLMSGLSMSSFAQAGGQAPKSAPRSAAGYLSRGNARWKKGNLDGAIADYTKAIQLDPNFADAYLNRGAARNLKDDSEGAMADYSKAIELDPNPADAYLYRGILLNDKGSLDSALVDFNKAIELNPRSAPAYNHRGVARDRKGELDSAIADYSKALALDPGYVEAFYNRGNARNKRGEWGGAIADLTELIKIDPRLAEAYNHRAWPYLILNRNDLAYRDASAYLDLEGARGEEAAYVVLIAYFAKQRAGDTKANAILDDWGPRLNSSPWPYAVIRYLRREITEQELLGSAIDKDQTTEARAYLGMSLLLSGQREAALMHLRWVREKGAQKSYEYMWAINALRRLEAGLT